MKWHDMTIAGDGYMRTKARINGDDTMTIRHEQDPAHVAEVLSMNVALNNRDRRSTSLWDNRNFVHVARIPEELIIRWQIEEGINFYRCNEDDRARLFAKLNDSEYRQLRTGPGRI